MGSVVYSAEVQRPRICGIEPVAQLFGLWAARGDIIAINFSRKIQYRQCYSRGRIERVVSQSEKRGWRNAEFLVCSDGGYRAQWDRLIYSTH